MVKLIKHLNIVLVARWIPLLFPISGRPYILPQPWRDPVVFDRRSLSKQLETEVSGFIGFASLNRMKVSIRYRDGWVGFEESH